MTSSARRKIPPPSDISCTTSAIACIADTFSQMIRTATRSPIAYINRAVSLTEESGGEELADRLADLATSLSSRFEHTKQLSDLDEAVSALRRSVSLTLPSDAHIQARSNRLGEVLWRRFEVTGSTKNLEDAIQAQTAGSPVGQSI